jgi:hypothetical protein
VSTNVSRLCNKMLILFEINFDFLTFLSEFLYMIALFIWNSLPNAIYKSEKESSKCNLLSTYVHSCAGRVLHKGTSTSWVAWFTY